MAILSAPAETCVARRLDCGLQARKIAGTESQAMVLCASDASKSKLGFVTPPEGSAPGELVSWEVRAA